MERDTPAKPQLGEANGAKIFQRLFRSMGSPASLQHRSAIAVLGTFLKHHRGWTTLVHFGEPWEFLEAPASSWSQGDRSSGKIKNIVSPKSSSVLQWNLGNDQPRVFSVSSRAGQ
eukprot:scaffold656_cov403-Pavlova_lutheri.AAC.25